MQARHSFTLPNAKLTCLGVNVPVAVVGDLDGHDLGRAHDERHDEERDAHAAQIVAVALVVAHQLETNRSKNIMFKHLVKTDICEI